jgi:hypothetical protein
MPAKIAPPMQSNRIGRGFPDPAGFQQLDFRLLHRAQFGPQDIHHVLAPVALEQIPRARKACGGSAVRDQFRGPLVPLPAERTYFVQPRQLVRIVGNQPLRGI